MKRATLLLEDQLYFRAKKLSQRRGTSLKDVINELIRRGFDSMSESINPKNFELPLYKKNGPLPGVDISDRSSLYDLMDEN